MSDRVSGTTTLETRMDDLRVVLDAAASKRSAILAGYPWGRTEERHRMETDRQLAIFGPRPNEQEPARLLGQFDEDRFERAARWQDVACVLRRNRLALLLEVIRDGAASHS